jgi:phosphatidate cytidylyltransferase
MTPSPRFTKRLLSALVLGPLALALLVASPVTFLVVVIPAFLIAAYEWAGLVRAAPRRKWVMAVVGAMYIPLAFYCFIALRFLPDDVLGPTPDVNATYGLRINSLLIFTLLVGVWFSDIGGYVFGKTIGGPKLIPSISPNKTWAGLMGALLFPALFLFLPGYVAGVQAGSYHPVLWAVLAGLALGVVGQMGDLFISTFKRRAGVKDAGNLIPGHGGLLDRIDSLMMVAVAAFIAVKIWT